MYRNSTRRMRGSEREGDEKAADGGDAEIGIEVDVFGANDDCRSVVVLWSVVIAMALVVVALLTSNAATFGKGTGALIFGGSMDEGASAAPIVTGRISNNSAGEQ